MSAHVLVSWHQPESSIWSKNSLPAKLRISQSRSRRAHPGHFPRPYGQYWKFWHFCIELTRVTFQNNPIAPHWLPRDAVLVPARSAAPRAAGSTWIWDTIHLDTCERSWSCLATLGSAGCDVTQEIGRTFFLKISRMHCQFPFAHSYLEPEWNNKFQYNNVGVRAIEKS